MLIKNTTRIVVLLLSVSLIAGLALVSLLPGADNEVEAHAGDQDLHGYAWSSTIGWISMNCENESTCEVSDYKVELKSDNTLEGYAWSSNIGWIQFSGLSGLSGFPSGAGTVAIDAQITAGGKLEGWARAVRPINHEDQTLGGWDGWISLSGIADDGEVYEVILSDDKFSGYSWGGDVVGWIQWDLPADSDNGVNTNNPFNYLLDPEDVVVRQGDIENSLITIQNTSTKTEDVEIVSITVEPAGLIVTIDGDDSCQPSVGGECSVGLLVEADAAAVRFYDIVVNSRSMDSGIEKEETFTVNVKKLPLNVVCEVQQDPALVNREVTWRALFTNTDPAVTYSFEWQGTSPIASATNPTSSGTFTGDTAQIEHNVIYRTVGRKIGRIVVTGPGVDESDVCEDLEIPVIADPDFKEF